MFTLFTRTSGTNGPLVLAPAEAYEAICLPTEIYI